MLPSDSLPAPLSAAERVEAPAVALGRPGGQVGAGRPGKSPLLAAPVPFRRGFRRLLVQRRGDRRGATPLRHGAHDDDVFVWTRSQPNLIADLNQALSAE